MATDASAPRDECDLVWMSIPSHGIWPEHTNSDSICCLVQKQYVARTMLTSKMIQKIRMSISCFQQD